MNNTLNMPCLSEGHVFGLENVLAEKPVLILSLSYDWAPQGLGRQKNPLLLNGAASLFQVASFILDKKAAWRGTNPQDQCRVARARQLVVSSQQTQIFSKEGKGRISQMPLKKINKFPLGYPDFNLLVETTLSDWWNMGCLRQGLKD